jgi:hypothetical protein
VIKFGRKEFSVLNGLEWIVLTAAVLGVFVVGERVLCGGHAYCREFMAGNSSDGLRRQLDRAEDRGDRHDHRARHANRQNSSSASRSRTSLHRRPPIELTMECPERDGLPKDGLSGEGSPRRVRI